MKKLLIVDDQAFYLKSLEIALRKKFEILLAMNYASTIEMLTCTDVEIALIDIRLNEQDEDNVDGLRILEWIRMNRPQISCFMMSAFRNFNSAEQALNLGARHFFKKPIDIISLIAILEEKS
jgi:DNA-binding NtrC family response regulator